ncbi:MAG: hypothetical protein HZB91_00255 [Elusimicrobia bacterium]|nr:hypothetical protein [Elusimicrobiota bacterium]
MASRPELTWQRSAAAATAISVAATFLVGSYEFVRSTSTSLFIAEYGSTRLPYAMTAVPFAMALLVYCYGWLLSRMGAMKTLVVSSLGSGLMFVLTYGALKADIGPAAAFLYVFRQVYIVLIVEQYWSLINSFLKPEQARLYNGPIIGGASVGPVLAGWLIHRKAVAMGSEQILLLAVAALIPATLLAYLSYRLAGEPKPSAEEAGGKQGHLNLSLLKQNRSLLLLAGVVCLAQIVSTAADLRFSALLEATIPGKDERTAFLGGFWSTTNLASSCLQFVVTPLLLSILPTRWIFLGIPAIHIASASYLLARPSLQSAALSLLLFKCVDYSLFRAAKELIYIPLSYDSRYRAKQVIDTFTYRASMGLTSAAFSAVTMLAGVVPGGFYPAAMIGAAAGWAGLALPLTAPTRRERPDGSSRSTTGLPADSRRSAGE